MLIYVTGNTEFNSFIFHFQNVKKKKNSKYLYIIMI